MRSLERELASICRKVARQVAKAGEKFKPVKLTGALVRKYLGVAKYRFGQAELEDRVGVCTGLAYTETGGELLQTEVSVTPGKGKLIVTGRLGEVMQESANAALSYIRSRAKQLGLTSDFYSKVDLHIHVPEGAIPKDGPSAGITIATAIASALTRVPVRANVAMTGEITLRGRVLPDRRSQGEDDRGASRRHHDDHRSQGEREGPEGSPRPHQEEPQDRDRSSTWTRCCRRRWRCPT